MPQEAHSYIQGSSQVAGSGKHSQNLLQSIQLFQLFMEAIIFIFYFTHCMHVQRSMAVLREYQNILSSQAPHFHHKEDTPQFLHHKSLSSSLWWWCPWGCWPGRRTGIKIAPGEKKSNGSSFQYAVSFKFWLFLNVERWLTPIKIINIYTFFWKITEKIRKGDLFIVNSIAQTLKRSLYQFWIITALLIFLQISTMYFTSISCAVKLKRVQIIRMRRGG